MQCERAPTPGPIRGWVSGGERYWAEGWTGVAPFVVVHCHSASPPPPLLLLLAPPPTSRLVPFIPESAVNRPRVGSCPVSFVVFDRAAWIRSSFNKSPGAPQSRSIHRGRGVAWWCVQDQCRKERKVSVRWFLSAAFRFLFVCRCLERRAAWTM